MRNLHPFATTTLYLLLRHAERESIPLGTYGNDVALTDKGKIACLQWRASYGHSLQRVYTSPIKRCINTAELLIPPSVQLSIQPSTLLGDPGIFVQDCALVQPYFLNYPLEQLVQRLLASQPNPPGFCICTQHAIEQLLNFICKQAQEGLSIYITHDSILAVVLGYYFPHLALSDLWPQYLEGLAIVPAGDNLILYYREHVKHILWPPC